MDDDKFWERYKECKKRGHRFQALFEGFQWCGICGALVIPFYKEEDDYLEYENDGKSVHYNGRLIRPVIEINE